VLQGHGEGKELQKRRTIIEETKEGRKGQRGKVIRET
jgi:hypothetical protein